MRALVIFDSTFENTGLVARAVVTALEGEASVEMTPADRCDRIDVTRLDLLVVGAPTHRRGLSLSLRQHLAALPPGALDGVAAAAFDTRCRMPHWLTGSAARRIGHLLRRRGARLVVPAQSFHVTCREGPLDTGEIEAAAEWAHTVMRRCREHATPPRPDRPHHHAAA